MAIFWVEVFLGRSSLGGNFPGGNCPGGIYLSGSYALPKKDGKSILITSHTPGVLLASANFAI